MKAVEIIDEENLIMVEDDYTDNTFEFFPEQKVFKVDVSVKDDYHHNESTIEYKISVNPIELWMRTTELSHKYIGGNDWSIKDGVVLESELKKNKFNDQERIDGLKKEVEWTKASILGNPEVNLYILSKHPEIVSTEDYRKFLRQSLERLKLGVSKVEEAVGNDKHGLAFQTGDYGRAIWYSEGIVDEDASSKYWELPEAKRDESKYGKQLKYLEEFNDSIFKEDSPNYVGIADFEFRNSESLIEYIEALLDKKATPSTKTEPALKTNKKSENGWKWLVVIGLSIVALSWGIWTAVGVFVLGVIILSVLSYRG